MITLPNIAHNLIPATLGNIVGSAGFVGVIYYSSSIAKGLLAALTPLVEAGHPAGR